MRIPPVWVRPQRLQEDRAKARQAGVVMLLSRQSGMAHPQAEQAEDTECHPNPSIHASQDPASRPQLLGSGPHGSRQDAQQSTIKLLVTRNHNGRGALRQGMYALPGNPVGHTTNRTHADPVHSG